MTVKNVFIIFARDYESPIIGIASNLKEVHKILKSRFESESKHGSADLDKCPSYSQVAKDFKDRKDFAMLSKFYYKNDGFECLTFDVVYGEMNIDLMNLPLD